MRRLRQLFYLSRADSKITEQDVRQILLVAQRNNRQKDITGCLLYSGAHFAQVLEGDAKALDEVLGSIKNDARHHSIVVALDHEVLERRFPDWSMGILYKLDMEDRVERLLVGDSEVRKRDAFGLFKDVSPDSVMGSL